MRAFMAVELARETHKGVVDGLAELRRALPRSRWVRPDAVHITLKFLGEQEPDLLQRLADCGQDALARMAPVEIALAGGGFFPSPRRPRVAWLGGRADGLDGWASVLDECAGELGLPREERRFSLHVTLARLERAWGADAVEAFLAMVSDWRLPPFVAREVVLFRSELLPTGAVHTPLRRLPAGEGGGTDGS